MNPELLAYGNSQEKIILGYVPKLAFVWYLIYK